MSLVSSANNCREGSAAKDDGLVMERWKDETRRSQQIAPSSLSNPNPATSVSDLQNRLWLFDRTGQIAPPGMKAIVRTALWEDEGSLCFQIEAKGVCVARREDNRMINGTKLLNVAGMTRGRRDGILKTEKTRHVVKTGPMHLKGVWIPHERALELANEEKITESLYPLFVHDIGSLVTYHGPRHKRTINPPKPQIEHQQAMEQAERKDDDVRQIDVSENSDKGLRKHLRDTGRYNKPHEQGPVGSLYKSLIETLGLIITYVKTQSDMGQHHGSLESSCAALFFWGNDLGLWRGELDDILQDSPQLRETCLTVLVSISQFVSTSLIRLISSEPQQKEVLQSTGILTSLEQTMNMIDQQHHHSTYRPEQDVEALCQTLRTKIDTLIMLAPSLASPADESFDDEEPRAIQDTEEHVPEQAYANSISQKFPLATPAIVARLGKLNWDRYNHVLQLQRETWQQEIQTTALEKALTIFHDSGLGVSLPTQSEVGVPESVYAPSMVSSRAEASHKRVPPLPAHARAGEPFTCEICDKQVRFTRTKAWKKHVFDDVLAYACFFDECPRTRVFFENSEALMTHLQDCHDMDVRVSDVACPLCIEFTSRDRDVLSLHLSRHMEEIALAVLPSGVESDEEHEDDSTSDATSNKADDESQMRQDDHGENLALQEGKLDTDAPAITDKDKFTYTFTYSDRGTYTDTVTDREAERRYRDILVRREKGPGPNHRETLTTMNNLAFALHRQDKFEEAEMIYRQTLERQEETLGREHRNTLECIENIGHMLSGQGRFAQAETMYRRALDGFEKVLGQGHPRTLDSCKSLAILLRGQREFKEKEAMLRRTLEGCERTLGQMHPTTLATVRHLGFMLQKQGDSEKAEIMYRRALDGFEKIYGREDPATLACASEYNSLREHKKA